MLIFGLDLPLPELLLVFGFVVLIAVIFLMYAIKKINDVNKKLDSVLIEQIEEVDTLKSFKSELDETMQDENKQLEMIKSLATKIDDQRAEGKQEIEILQGIREELKVILEEENKQLDMLKKKQNI